MNAWSNFYSVLGGATATLLGLLFVAISLNARQTFGKAYAASSRLAEQAFQNYLAVLAVSLLALIPGISVPTFASVAIGVTGLYAVYVVVRVWQATASSTAGETRTTRYQIVRRYVSSLVGFGMMIVAAILMASKQVMELNLFAAATIVLLFSATEVSWAFLKRVAQLEGD